jgi:hypothetical protein
MNSNTVAIIWLCLVAAFLLTMFFAARGGKPAPGAGAEAGPPATPKPPTPPAAPSADNTGKQS